MDHGWDLGCFDLTNQTGAGVGPGTVTSLREEDLLFLVSLFPGPAETFSDLLLGLLPLLLPSFGNLGLLPLFCEPGPLPSPLESPSPPPDGSLVGLAAGLPSPDPLLPCLADRGAEAT